MFANVSPIPISPIAHKEAGWSPPKTWHFTAGETVVPVIASEIMMLKDMPLAFVRSIPDGPFELGAIQSLQPERNLYVDDSGQWLGWCIPMFYRCFPFRMMPIENSEKTALCVQPSDNFNEQASGADQRLFDATGSMTPEMSEQLKLVKTFDKGLRLTRKLVAQLDSLGLIVPWELFFQAGSPETAKPVKGLYHIDEEALKDLSPEQAKSLLDSGAAALAYGQLFSEHCVDFLGLQYRKISQLAELSSLPDIDTLFNEQEDDLFKFD